MYNSSLCVCDTTVIHPCVTRVLPVLSVLMLLVLLPVGRPSVLDVVVVGLQHGGRSAAWWSSVKTANNVWHHLHIRFQLPNNAHCASLIWQLIRSTLHKLQKPFRPLKQRLPDCGL